MDETTNAPVSTTVEKAEDKSKLNKNLIIAGAVGAVGVLLCVVILIILLATGALNQSGNQPTTSDTTPDDIGDTRDIPTPTEEQVDPQNDFFMAKDDVVYTYNSESNNLEEVFDFTGTEYVSDSRPISYSLEYISETELGFASCTDTCRIYKLDITTGEIEMLEEYGREGEILFVRFKEIEGTLYAGYFFRTEDGKQEDILLSQYYSDGSRSGALIDTITGDGILGRGVGEADDVDIEFSPDGRHIAFIATFNVENSANLETKIYNIENPPEIIETLDPATHPKWIDNSKLLYVSGSKLFEYNLTSGSEVETFSSSEFDLSYSYSLRDSEILFSNTAKDVFYADVQSGAVNIIDNFGSLPFWLSERYIGFTRVVVEEMSYDGFNSVGSVIYDFEEGEIVKSFDEEYSFITRFDY